MKQKFVLTFDLEFWYNSHFLDGHAHENNTSPEDYILESTKQILDLLKQHGHKATFFILGQVAEKYPDLIKKIASQNHEIASHGYSHLPLTQLDPESFETEIIQSKNILEKITNEKIVGFRAPNFSLDRKNPWPLKILARYAFSYDSSCHPLSLKKIISRQLREIHPSLGGIYFRILPLWLYLILLRFFSKETIPVLYFHPYEFFEAAPRIKSGPWLKRKVKYLGTVSAWKKFQKLVRKSDFISIKQYLQDSSS